MIQIIIHAFIENGEIGVVEVVFASENSQAISEKMAELQNQYPNDYLAIYDLPLDTDLSKLSHYPSVAIGKEEFDNVDEATEVILTYEDDIVVPKIADTEGVKIISQS